MVLVVSGGVDDSLGRYCARIPLLVYIFFGEANRFPKFNVGGLVVFPFRKCLLQTE